MCMHPKSGKPNLCQLAWIWCVAGNANGYLNEEAYIQSPGPVTMHSPCIGGNQYSWEWEIESWAHKLKIGSKVLSYLTESRSRTPRAVCVCMSGKSLEWDLSDAANLSSRNSSILCSVASSNLYTYTVVLEVSLQELVAAALLHHSGNRFPSRWSILPTSGSESLRGLGHSFAILPTYFWKVEIHIPFRWSVEYTWLGSSHTSQNVDC